MAPEVAKPAALQQKRSRVFEEWQELGGRNRFLCAGRVFVGPGINRCHFACSWLFVFVPTFTCLGVCGEFLWRHQPWLPVAIVVCFCVTLVFLLLASFTDPGVVPRRKLQQLIPGLETEVAQATGVHVLKVDPQTGNAILDISREQEVQGYRWCHTCQVIRPPRASHCKHCDNCVLRMDHHCPFLQNCIGQRNYGYFMILLVLCISLASLVTAGVVLYSMAAYQHHVDAPVRGDALTALLIIIGAPTEGVAVSIVGLFAFHVWLICRGRTTRETLTSQSFQPSSKASTFSMKRSRSLLPARAFLDESENAA
jgi:hypothetical protein